MSMPVAGTADPPPAPMPPPPAPLTARPPAAVIAAAAVAIIAAGTLSWDRPGLGWALTALVVVTAVLTTVRSRGRATGLDRYWSTRTTIRAGWVTAAVALLAVGAFRAAGWLFVLCVLTAGVIACVALADRFSLVGVLLALIPVLGAVPRALRWLVRGGTRTPHHHRGPTARTLITALITVTLLLVFGALLAGADAAFAHLLSSLVPSLDAATMTRWICSAALAGTVTTVAMYLLITGGPPPDEQYRLGPVRRIEWALPVGGLVVLFAGFVAIQATVLFGGHDHVMATAGLTYADYARSGFWQLLAVTALTLVVVGVAAQIAPRTTTADRTLLRTLLGLLSAQTLVIVASALSRMAAYEQAYGFTRRRLLVTTCELWLGVVFLLILVAGIHLHGRWIPQAALATAVAALLGLAILNPDAFIARHNIARHTDIRHVDVTYLAGLSADAVPALQSLPDPYRSCALAAITTELAQRHPDTWTAANLGRATARAQLRDHPPYPIPCPP